jgi:hypothetical protein
MKMKDEWSYEEQFEAVFLESAPDESVIKWLKENQFSNDLLYPNFWDLRKLNRYHFTRHLSVIQNGYKRGEYEQQSIHRRI